MIPTLPFEYPLRNRWAVHDFGVNIDISKSRKNKTKLLESDILKSLARGEALVVNGSWNTWMGVAHICQVIQTFI